MIAKLTDEQRHALETGGGRPVEVQDERNDKVYYLLNESAYLHLQGLQAEHEQQSHDRLRRLIEEGMESPGVPADKAFARLREIAVRLSRPTT